MKEKARIYELTVIGGGAAGVAAAVHAKATLSNVLLIEKKKIGGKVNEIALVSNHIGVPPQVEGKKLGLMMKKQLLENGGCLVKWLEVTNLQREKNIFLIKGQNHCFYSHSVIIATGSHWKELELEKASKTHRKNFLYRVASDAYLARDKAVLVVGGGYSGCQAADFLSKFAKKVYLIHRGGELTVDFKLKSRILENNKIKVYLNSIILETGGEKKLESCTISINNDSQKKLAISAIFPCIGVTPNSELVREIVDCTATGHVKVNSNFQTNIEGLFAAGDVILKNNSRITTASAEGTYAAQSAIRYFLKKV